MSQLDSNYLLRYIDVLLKHGNFTKAAKELYISQPYLTQVIQKIEQNLAIKIIDRTSNRLQLTEAGKVYYEYLETIEEESNRLNNRLARFTTNDQLLLHIGILSSLGTFLLPLFLPEFLAQHDQVKILIDEDLPKNNELKLLNSEIDFYIGQNPETVSPDIAIQKTDKQKYYAIIPASQPFYQADHFLLQTEQLDFSQLLHAPFVLTTNGSAIRRQINQLFAKYKVQPDIVLESSNIYTVAEFAKKGLGVTFAPESILSFAQNGAYNLYPLPDESISLDYFIAYSAKKTLNQTEKSFIETFLTQVQQTI